jgi:hypothetical protein
MKHNNGWINCPVTDIQSLDRSEYAMMSSLDLSAAFDVVNVFLLIKRLTIISLPIDVVDFI